MRVRTSDREPEPYCLITHVIEGHIRLMDIPESVLPWAIKHGWSVLAKDSDVPGSDRTGHQIPVKSNPKRSRFFWHGSEEGD